MKKMIILFLAQTLFAPVQAQNDYPALPHEVILSEAYPVVNAPNKYYFTRDNQILTVKVKGSDFVVLQKIDAVSMKEVENNKYPDLPKKFTITDVIQINDKILLFYSVWNRKARYQEIFYREIDFHSATLGDKEVFLMRTGGKPAQVLRVNQPGGMSMTTEIFNLKSSFDKSKLLITYKCLPEKSNDNRNHDRFGFFVFNKELKQLWGEEVQMPYSEADLGISNYTIDNSGNVYLSARIYNRKLPKSVNRKNKYEAVPLEIFRIPATTRKLEIIAIEIPDITVRRFWLRSGTGETILCAGLYGDELVGSEGLITFKIKSEGTIYDIATHPFTKMDVDKIKEPDDKPEVFDDIELKEIIHHNDGSIMLIGEQTYQIIHDRPNSSINSVVYFYNFLLVGKINKDNQLVWMKKLSKNQMGFKPIGPKSYKYFKIKDDHYLFYLDNPNNIALPEGEYPKGFHDGSTGYLTARKVNDNNGSVEKLHLVKMVEKGKTPLYQFWCNKLLLLNSDEIAFEAYIKDKSDAVVKVKLFE